MTTDATENHDATSRDGSRLSDGLGVVGAEDMAVMRMQAGALAFQWLVARDYKVHADGYAFMLLRAEDFGLRDAVMNGKRIRVALSFEDDA